MSNQFNVGDKVLYRSYISNDREGAYEIVSIERKRHYSSWCGEFFTDCTIVSPNGRKDETTFDKLYLANERSLKVHGKKKWDVKGVNQNNGYFGSFSIIELDGKKCVVYCDDRDALVRVVTDWYDDILACSWSGDCRWNHDRPCIVYDKEKGYALNEPNKNNLISDWCESIDTKWCYEKNIGEYLKGVKDGCEVYIIKGGNIVKSETANPKNYENVLKMCKSFTNDEVVSLWIEKGFPCAHIHGLEYKGASASRVSKEKAKELFKTHCRFNGMFNSAEWRIYNGEVTLLMRDYANSDYD